MAKTVLFDQSLHRLIALSIQVAKNEARHSSLTEMECLIEELLELFEYDNNEFDAMEFVEACK